MQRQLPTVDKSDAELKYKSNAQSNAWMQSVTFTYQPPVDLLEADITFATAESFVTNPPVCPEIYVTYKFAREKLHMLTSWMPRYGR